jgi:hypothetical protein
MSMFRGWARALVASIVGLCVVMLGTSGVRAAPMVPGFPGPEEIQSVAYTRDSTYGINGWIGAQSLLGLSDIAATGAVNYTAHRTGISNFTTHTLNVGIIKFCGIASYPELCYLRPHAERLRNGEFLRAVDTTVNFGSGMLYEFEVVKVVFPNGTVQWKHSYVRVISPTQREYVTLLSTTGAEWDSLYGAPYAYTGAASTGPSWGFAKTQNAKAWPELRAPLRNYCYDAQNNRNALDARMPVVTGCNPLYSNWMHDLSRRVYIPVAIH